MLAPAQLDARVAFAHRFAERRLHWAAINPLLYRNIVLHKNNKITRTDSKQLIKGNTPLNLLSLYVCFPDTGHVITVKGTVSFTFCLIHVHGYA